MSSTQILGLQNLPLKLLLLALHVKKFGAPILPDSFKCKISEMKRAHVREGADSGKDCGGLGSPKRHNRGQFVSEGRSSNTFTHERKKRVKKCLHFVLLRSLSLKTQMRLKTGMCFFFFLRTTAPQREATLKWWYRWKVLKALKLFATRERTQRRELKFGYSFKKTRK